MQRIWIRGAGDLATGIAVRLYRSGFDIVMTDLERPTTVRRTVAFSRAVYEKEATVEGVRAVFCHSMQEIAKAHAEHAVAVVVDRENILEKEYKPDVLVDAIIAKRNIATSIEDASIVIGVGPGFVANKDCHAVIETKRGHDLGRMLLEGSAIPNTGIPGEIGGYSLERLLKSKNAGVFRAAKQIGDAVQKGDTVAYVGETAVLAQIDGVVRGMLQGGITVSENFKLGDIDPRAKVEHCYSVSDKARAIGGGVLEAILYFSKGKHR